MIFSSQLTNQAPYCKYRGSVLSGGMDLASSLLNSPAISTVTKKHPTTALSPRSPGTTKANRLPASQRPSNNYLWEKFSTQDRPSLELRVTRVLFREIGPLTGIC